MSEGRTLAALAAAILMISCKPWAGPTTQILTDTEATIIMVVGSIANGTGVMAGSTIINWDH